MWPIYIKSEIRYTYQNTWSFSLVAKSEDIDGKKEKCMTKEQVDKEIKRERAKMKQFEKEYKETNENINDIVDTISDAIDIVQKIKDYRSKK